MEIMSPRRPSLQDTVVCDCCRRLKLASEFDQDCCGICADCLDADPVLFDLDATSEQAFEFICLELSQRFRVAMDHSDNATDRVPMIFI